MKRDKTLTVTGDPLCAALSRWTKLNDVCEMYEYSLARHDNDTGWTGSGLTRLDVTRRLRVAQDERRRCEDLFIGLTARSLVVDASWRSEMTALGKTPSERQARRFVRAQGVETLMRCAARLRGEE